VATTSLPILRSSDRSIVLVLSPRVKSLSETRYSNHPSDIYIIPRLGISYVGPCFRRLFWFLLRRICFPADRRILELWMFQNILWACAQNWSLHNSNNQVVITQTSNHQNTSPTHITSVPTHTVSVYQSLLGSPLLR
jgi:hypothetical protein